MKERPILFSGEMVQAILAGRKSVTRRVVNPQPHGLTQLHWTGLSCFTPEGKVSLRGIIEDGNVGEWWRRCPYGKPGDGLWVREVWRFCGTSWHSLKPEQMEYRTAYADGTRRSITAPSDSLPLPRQRPQKDDESDVDYSYYLRVWWNRWRPSIHMPRWASRIDLRVTGVRVERVQEISEEDAKAEGVEAHNDDGVTYYGPHNQGHIDARVAFSWLWDSINGSKPGRSWEDNPWTWIVEFERVRP